MTRWQRALPLSAFGLAVLLPGCSDKSSDSGGSPYPPVVRFDAQAGALHGNPDTAFDPAGDGIAVWTESPLDGSPSVSRVLGSVYTQASGTWSTGAELALNAAAPRVATKGTGLFMAVWIGCDAGLYTVQARAYGAAGWDASATVLRTTFDTVEGVRIASNGTGYGVVWSERGASAARVFASLYSGATWDASATVLDGGGAWAARPAIAGKASSDDYAVAWIQENAAGTEWRIYSALHATTPAWGAASLRSTTTGEAGTCRLASNGSGYLLAWSQVDGSSHWSLFADVHNGAAWGGAADVDGTTDDCDRPDATSNGSGYAVAWRQLAAAGNHDVAARRHDGAAWAAAGVEAVEASAIDAGAPRAASDGTNYALAWSGLDGTLRNVYASFFGGTDWGAPATVESGAGDCREGDDDLPSVRGHGAAYAFAWSQFASASAGAVLTVYARPYAGAWGTQTDLVGATWESGAVRPQVAVNDAGTALAAWEQYRDGVAEIWGSLRTAGAWSAPFAVGQPGGMPAVATDGTGFMAAWSDPATGIVARAYAGGVWDVSGTIVDSRPGLPLLASNGTTYGLVWNTAAREIHASIHGAGWAAAVTLSGNGDAPCLAATGTDYVLVCRERSGGVDHLLERVYTSSWSAGTWLDGGGNTDSVSGPAVAARGTECCATWSQAGRIYAQFRSGGTWQGSPASIDDGTSLATRPAIAASDTGYAAVWQQGGDILARLADGSTWQGTPQAIDFGPGAALQPRIVSNGTGFTATWLQFDGTYDTLLIRRCDNSVWGSTYALENWGADIDPDHVLARDGTRSLSLWSQVDPADLVRRDVWCQGF